MISIDYINEWRQYAPWEQSHMIEQDLLITRILIELFTHPILSTSLAFRGGTALYKLFIQPPLRYSEDIDLVQVNAMAIGETLGIIKEILAPWLGKPKWKLNAGRATLLYRFVTEESNLPAKIKIEINTREHFSVFGYQQQPFNMTSSWFSGKTTINTYDFNELIGTKIRALYQRKKSRDLFDLWIALQYKDFDAQKAIQAFQHYLKIENTKITRALFEENLAEKMNSTLFTADISPILSQGIHWNMRMAAKTIHEKLITLMPGAPHKKNKITENSHVK